MQKDNINRVHKNIQRDVRIQWQQNEKWKVNIYNRDLSKLIGKDKYPNRKMGKKYIKIVYAEQTQKATNI